MSRNRTPPEKPRRRVYRTGETLPNLTTDFRRIPVGLDEDGEPDGQVRAFAVNIRNLSDTSIFVTEGREAEGDAAEIGRFENYTIWETNGINGVNLRGSEGGETVEFRNLEAHNDFGIRDRIEAFVRAISHFFATSKQETVITDSETVISTNIEGSDVTFDTTIGDIAEGVTMPTNITGSDVQLDTSIGDVGAGVNFDTTITGSDVEIPVTGDVTATIGDISEGVTFDVIGDVDATIGDIAEGVSFDTNIIGSDVQFDTSIGNVAEGVTMPTNITASEVALDTTITGSEVTQAIDIETQSVGDINTLPRVGQEKTRFLNDTASAGYIDDQFLEYFRETHDWGLYTNATFDGEIRHIWVRFTPADDTDWGPSRLDTLGFVLIVNGDAVSPSYLSSGWGAGEFNRRGGEAYVSRNDTRHEVIYGWEPKGGKVPTFTKGDDVDLRIGTATNRWMSPEAGGSTNDFEVEAEVMVTERVGE